MRTLPPLTCMFAFFNAHPDNALSTVQAFAPVALSHEPGTMIFELGLAK
jgi:hypothetical protein